MAPNCIEGVCVNEVAPLSTSSIIILTGVVSLLIGMVIGWLLHRVISSRRKGDNSDALSSQGSDPENYNYDSLTPPKSNSILSLSSNNNRKVTIGGVNET
jgi:hypothetical protein